LKAGVAEEAVGVEIFVGDVFEGFFVGGTRSSQLSGVTIERSR